jgi:hypothetical protein
MIPKKAETGIVSTLTLADFSVESVQVFQENSGGGNPGRQGDAGLMTEWATR